MVMSPPDGITTGNKEGNGPNSLKALNNQGYLYYLNNPEHIEMKNESRDEGIEDRTNEHH